MAKGAHPIAAEGHPTVAGGAPCGVDRLSDRCVRASDQRQRTEKRADPLQGKSRAADARDMIEKGYPHPLYSLDLLPHAAVLEDEPRYGILLAQGRLVVRAELRRRAADHSVLAIDHLVGTALAYERLSPRSFADFGV